MCVLRCYAPRFDVDAFLERSPWKPVSVSHRGQKRWQGARRLSATSGFNVDVSHREFADWAGQIRDATRWLLRHAKEIRRARRAAGEESLVLDFAYGLYEDAWPTFLRLPVRLVERAARLGVALEVSVYLITRRRPKRPARGKVGRNRGRGRE